MSFTKVKNLRLASHDISRLLINLSIVVHVLSIILLDYSVMFKNKMFKTYSTYVPDRLIFRMQ